MPRYGGRRSRGPIIFFHRYSARSPSSRRNGAPSGLEPRATQPRRNGRAGPGTAPTGPVGDIAYPKTALPGCVSFTAKRPAFFGGGWREAEVEPMPIAGLGAGEPGAQLSCRPRVSMATGQLRGPLRADPYVTLVRLSFLKTKPPAVEALILDADFALAVDECDPLALRTDKRSGRFQGKSAAGRATLDRPPHVAYFKAANRVGWTTSGLLKTLAEEHLAIQPAVDLVVHVLDAGDGQVAADARPRLLGMNDDGSVLRGRVRGQPTCCEEKTKVRMVIAT